MTRDPRPTTHRQPTTVLKLGGALLADEAAVATIWSAVAGLDRVVLVHGGGPQATALAKRLGHTPRMVHGRRVTTALDLDVLLWEVSGRLNARLVAAAQAAGVRAVGLTGADGALVQVHRRPPWTVDGETVDFGHVGDVEGVDVHVLTTLLDAGLVPVVGPIGMDADGALYNVNADTIALELAAALQAEALVFAAEAGGVYRDLDDPTTRFDAITPDDAEAGKRDGWLNAGMRVKLDVGFEALHRGVGTVRIAAPTELGGGTGLTLEGADEQNGGGLKEGFSRPATLDPRPATPDPRPATLDPRPATLDPRPATLDLHAALIRFPSLSYQERAIADFVEAYAREHGGPRVTVDRVADNVIVGLGTGDDLLLLNSHLDVVPPSSDHPYPPFEPTVVDGKVYGRGAVDAKASGAAMLTALLTLARDGFEPTGGRLVVALTACEEASKDYNGVEHLRRDFFGQAMPQPSAALVGEPTELRPCLSQKGLLILRLHAMGRTAHAARAHLGANAIHVAARDLAALQALAFDRADPFLGLPTVTPTLIETGGAKNVVPDRCTITLDIRSTPTYPHSDLIDLIGDAVESEVEVYSRRLIPCATPADARIARACQRALPGLVADATPFGSPTASDWIFLGDVPTVKIGPGRSELSHTPEEHIEAAEVERAVEVYRAIVAAYFDS
ncbi:MAG: acetylglutamate kinase [Bacteroidota bacterium]